MTQIPFDIQNEIYAKTASVSIRPDDADFLYFEEAGEGFCGAGCPIPMQEKKTR